MFKKILFFGILALSFVLLMIAVVDLCLPSMMLTDSTGMRCLWLGLAVVSAGLTVITLLTQSFRHVLLLAIDLVQTILGGILIVYVVYEFCYPKQLDFGDLLPLVLICVAAASLIHTAAIGLFAQQYGMNRKYERYDELSPEGMTAKVERRSVAYGQTTVGKQGKPSGKDMVAAKMATTVVTAEPEEEFASSAVFKQVGERTPTQTVEIHKVATVRHLSGAVKINDDEEGAATQTLPISLPLSGKQDLAEEKTAAFALPSAEQTQMMDIPQKK